MVKLWHGRKWEEICKSYSPKMKMRVIWLTAYRSYFPENCLNKKHSPGKPFTPKNFLNNPRDPLNENSNKYVGLVLNFSMCFKVWWTALAKNTSDPSCKSQIKSLLFYLQIKRLYFKSRQGNISVVWSRLYFQDFFLYNN